LCFKNIKPSLPSTRFTFANNTFNNHYESDTLIFDNHVLKLNASNLIFENIIVEKQCSCHLAEKIDETKRNQKASLVESSQKVDVEGVWKSFEEKLDQSLSCYTEDGNRQGKRETVLLATMMKDCMTRASNLARIGIGLAASAFILTLISVAIFIFMRKREKDSVASDMKRLAVPEVLPKEEDYHMELEQAGEWVQGSLPDLLQTVGSKENTPRQSMQYNNGKSGAMDEISGSISDILGISGLSSTRAYTLQNSNCKVLSGHSNVLMRTMDPDVEEDKYTSMVIHNDRKSTE